MATTATALKPAIDPNALEESIRLRAWEIYTERGGGHGSDVDDWLRAETEILAITEEAIDEAGEESFPASDPPAL